MASHGDDVGALFKSFGADGGNFQELSRKSGAHGAQERWPLLKAVAPEKREQPPELSDSEKSHWKKPQTAFSGAAAPTPIGQGISAKLANGLRQLSSRANADAQPLPLKTATRAAPTPTPTAAPMAAQTVKEARPPQATAFHHPAPPSPIRHETMPTHAPAPQYEAPARPAPTRRALFAEEETVPESQHGLFSTRPSHDARPTIPQGASLRTIFSEPKAQEREGLFARTPSAPAKPLINPQTKAPARMSEAASHASDGRLFSGKTERHDALFSRQQTPIAHETGGKSGLFGKKEVIPHQRGAHASSTQTTGSLSGIFNRIEAQAESSAPTAPSQSNAFINRLGRR